MPGRSDMSSGPLGEWPVVATDRACPVDGRSVVGCLVTSDRWPVASGRTPLGTSSQGVATNMGLTPGSRAIRGSVPMFLSFCLMKQTHLETSFCWT